MIDARLAVEAKQRNGTSHARTRRVHEVVLDVVVVVMMKQHAWVFVVIFVARGKR